MSFAVPIAFALAALSLPIIGFYILKVRLRRVPTSTNLFWKQIFDEKPPRSLWQNFRHLLSLLLQLAFLLLLILAIADPYFGWQILQARRIVLVIDDSASMRAADILPSRFEAARRAANGIIDSLRFRDELAIVLAGKHPQVVIGMTNHVPTLKRTVQSLQVTDSSTELEPAIQLGQQLLGNHPHGQIIVLTDGCVATRAARTEETKGPEGTKEQEVANEAQRLNNRVVFHLFGNDANNVGITQFQVRRSLIDPIGYEILVEVKNASVIPLECRLELTLDDVPVDVLPLSLQPEQTWSRSIEKTSLNGGRLIASLTRIGESDGKEENAKGNSTATNKSNLNQLLTDDQAWAIVPRRQVQKVLIVSPGNLFLQKVFEANPLVEIRLAKELPPLWPDDTLIVLHRLVPSKLPDGNLFVIDPIEPSDQWELGGTIANPIVTEQDKNSPLMAHIRLDNVLMPEAKQLLFKTTPHRLAGVVTGEQVYSEVKRPSGKCLVLSVNLESSDLAFRTAFPILVTNALGWFAGKQGELHESANTGTIVSVEIEKPTNQNAEPGNDSLETRSPSNVVSKFQPAQADDSTTIDGESVESSKKLQSYTTWRGPIGPLNEIGIWNIVPALKSDKAVDVDEVELLYEVASNLANARESDLRPDAELRETSEARSESSRWLSRPLWVYLVFFACALTTAEWFLHQRRFIT